MPIRLGMGFTSAVLGASTSPISSPGGVRRRAKYGKRAGRRLTEGNLRKHVREGGT